MLILDEKNRLMLNLLQNNCRLSFTDLSKELDLSVDATKKRYLKLLKEELFFPKIQLRARQMGYPNIVDVNIELKDCNNKDYESFISFLVKHPRVIEVISYSGNYDIRITIISKNHEDLSFITKEIRSKYYKLINDWTEALTTIVYKFEKFDLEKLNEYDSKERAPIYAKNCE